MAMQDPGGKKNIFSCGFLLRLARQTKQKMDDS